MSKVCEQPTTVEIEDDQDDTDAILAELEAEIEDTNSAAYQARLRELHDAAPASKSSGTPGMPAARVQQDTYATLKSDDEALRFTTEHERAVLHFRHPDFARCSIMDDHLDRISQRHSYAEASGEEVAFARVDVTHVPFVVEKLGVRVLPCVIGFSKGIVKGKVVGFEGICWDSKEKDARVTKALEDTLFDWGVLKQKMLSDDHDVESDDGSADEEKGDRGIKVRRGIKGPKPSIDEDDDEWD